MNLIVIAYFCQRLIVDKTNLAVLIVSNKQIVKIEYLLKNISTLAESFVFCNFLSWLDVCV